MTPYNRHQAALYDVAWGGDDWIPMALLLLVFMALAIHMSI